MNEYMNKHVVIFNPATDDFALLPDMVIRAMNGSYSWDFDITKFQGQFVNVSQTECLELAREHAILAVTSNDADRILEILEEIEELSGDIAHGSDAWEAGDDECSMAECDPSDQYLKSIEISDLAQELKEIVGRVDQDINHT